MKEAIVVGGGFSGAVIARELAEQGIKVLLLEKRDHIGGNAYDMYNSVGILTHLYGPHVFHTKRKHVFDYLSQFTQWREYEHRVVANVQGLLLPLPFNETSFEAVFGVDWTMGIVEKLRHTYGNTTTILELQKSKDSQFKQVAEYIYEHIFYHYTKKQWGLRPEELDSSITARVPISLSRDDRYFQDEYQCMPRLGYTELFNCMLDHPYISLELRVDGAQRIHIDKGVLYFDNKPCRLPVVYTGAIDELFRFCYGQLPYRGISLEFENISTEYFQSTGTVNYTMEEPFTRITEFKYLTGQNIPHITTIAREFSYAYRRGSEGEASYPIIREENWEIYQKYRLLADSCHNLYMLGRLAQYQYLNMDDVVDAALALGKELLAV